VRPEHGGAAASDGGGASSRRVLIVGFGNTLRRDDGVGVRAAELLAADPRLAARQVEVRTAYQLLPEMALDMGAVSLVIFVDADLRGLPGSIEVRPIVADAPRSDADARAEPGASSHHVGGGELVALASALTGRRPEAVTIGIGVADTELGEGLSAAVEAALPRVVQVVADLVERHHRES
jgi:hydrogenase maturation protease